MGFKGEGEASRYSYICIWHQYRRGRGRGGGLKKTNNKNCTGTYHGVQSDTTQCTAQLSVLHTLSSSTRSCTSQSFPVCGVRVCVRVCVHGTAWQIHANNNVLIVVKCKKESWKIISGVLAAIYVLLCVKELSVFHVRIRPP